MVIFSAVTFVSFGSSYYHYEPNTFTLFWDRLPMSVGFMAVMAVLIAEKISKKVGVIMLVPLVLIGLLSVVHWIYTESKYEGDLRLYIIVQFGTIISAPLVLVFFPSRYSHSVYFGATLLFYISAKVAEVFDHQIFDFTNDVMSGHTLKHILAALSIEFIVVMLKLRKSLKSSISRL